MTEYSNLDIQLPHVSDREKEKFFVKDGKVYVRVAEEPAERVMASSSTSISTTATKLSINDELTSYIIFHQEEGEVVYYKENNTVSSSWAALECGDVLEIENEIDLELWMITATGTVNVFVVGSIQG